MPEPIVINDPKPEPKPEGKTLRDQISNALEAREQAALQTFADTLAELTKPERKVPVPPNLDPTKPHVSHFGFGDVRLASEAIYARLSPAQQAIRNPKSDESMGAWIRALSNGRIEQVEKISRELNDDFLAARGQRATTLYGTVTATSGLGQGTGGPIVPLPLASSIVLARNSRARMRSMAQLFLSGANTLRVPTSGVATAAMVAEGATAAQGEPTLGSQLLSKKKAQALFAASDEMLGDSAFNLVSFFTERAGSALGALEDVQFCTSNGASPNITESLESATITALAEATSTVLTYKDLVNLFFLVPEAYHAGSVFMGSSTMMGFLSTIVDGNGRPIFVPAVSAPAIVGDSMPSAVGTIFGRPVHLMPVTAGTLVVGDPSFYGILDDGGFTVRTSEHVGWATDTVQFKITERIDGAVLTEDAFREVAGITSVA